MARSTLARLERGERRPRPATLSALAYGLDSDRVDEITARLVEAAGPSLRPDTPSGIRRRARRMVKARRAAQREAWRLARAAGVITSSGVNVTVNNPVVREDADLARIGSQVAYQVMARG